MGMIATSFFFAYCVSNFECWFLFSRGLDNRLNKSYNTTPAEEGTRCSSLLLVAWFFWPHGYHLFLDGWPHVAVGVCFSALYVFVLRALSFLLCRWSIFERICHLKLRPHINHSVLGFDHIFDHKQNRSTRRQECTRVWKSRFCVAERSKKSKNG